jgi:peroxiredoxin
MMRNFRKILFLATLTAAVPMYAQVPVFELKDIENQWVTYDDVKGETLTVIDFWATWCQPCLRSIPKLNTLFEEFESRGVNFIGISVDGPRNQAKLKPFTSSLGVEYTVLRDVNSEVMTDMNVTSVPTLLIYDSDDNLLFLHEGFRPGDEEILREELEKHL